MRKLKRVMGRLAVGLAALLAFTIYNMSLDRHDFEAHFIDVGQGDCALITCGGESLLIDAGTPDSYEGIRRYLLKHGVSRLDYIVATHGHSDHIGSMTDVIEGFSPRQAFISHHAHDTNTYIGMLEALERKNIPTEAPERGRSFNLGDAVCSFIWTKEYEDANNSSLVLMVDYDGYRLLFTGDMEAEAERELLASNADISAAVLKVAHHGSSTSSTQEFIDAADPGIAIISVGKNNDYGHPHKEILERLSDRQVLRTDEKGSIVIWWDKDNSGVEWEK